MKIIIKRASRTLSIFDMELLKYINRRTTKHRDTVLDYDFAIMDNFDFYMVPEIMQNFKTDVKIDQSDYDQDTNGVNGIDYVLVILDAVYG